MTWAEIDHKQACTMLLNSQSKFRPQIQFLGNLVLDYLWGIWTTWTRDSTVLWVLTVHCSQRDYTRLTRNFLGIIPNCSNSFSASLSWTARLVCNIFSFAEAFSLDNDAWITTFSNVYFQMLKNGYTTLQSLDDWNFFSFHVSFSRYNEHLHFYKIKYLAI